MTSGRLTIVERADELPPEWERVARGRELAFDPRFLRALQPHIIDGSNRRYCIYESESGSTVIATAALIDSTSPRNPVANVLLGRLHNRLPALLDWLLPMLVLRTDTSGETPYCTDATESDRAATLRGLLAALGDHAARQGWSLAIDCVPAEDRAMSAACEERGYLGTLGRPCATMRIQWRTWADYLKSAARHSKRAATNIRTELNRGRREGLAIAEWQTAATPEAELHRLQVEHEARLNARVFPYKPGILGRLADELGEDFKVYLGTCDDQPKGVIAFGRSGNRGYVTFPGLVHKDERAGSLYFNLMYYHPIKLAIELGLDSIAFGNAALEAKIRRGCVVEAGTLCLRPRTAAMRAALRAPLALHRRGLLRKYGRFLQAAPFSSISQASHARPAD